MDSQSKSQTQLKAAVCVNKEQGKRKREWRSKDRLVKISDATQGWVCHCVWEKPYSWVIGRNLYDCMHKHNLSSTLILAFRDQLAQ